MRWYIVSRANEKSVTGCYIPSVQRQEIVQIKQRIGSERNLVKFGQTPYEFNIRENRDQTARPRV